MLQIFRSSRMEMLADLLAAQLHRHRHEQMHDVDLPGDECLRQSGPAAEQHRPDGVGQARLVGDQQRRGAITRQLIFGPN